MKYIRQIQVLFVLLLIAPLAVMAQDCVEYHKLGDCMMDRQKGYKFYSQSKSVSMSPTDTVEINVIFYGQKDYIFSFCTHAKLYPVHFVLIDPDSGDVLYDNANDKYIESLGIGFDVSKSLTIKVDVVVRKASEEEIEQYVGCLGLLIQYRNYTKKKVNLQM
ncbi:MAG: hypothetical protein KAI95_07575 [Bacteroidales bacterium]|nr:hypothetical protein [Bacteroidales bacterium]